MLLPDVNVLVNALNQDSLHHGRAAAWLRTAGDGDEAVGLSELVLSSVVRVITGASMGGARRTPLEAFAFADAVRGMPAGQHIREGPEHRALFRQLTVSAGVSGADITDAYLAAFALENDATFVTFDRGFRRFAGLRLLVLE